jgi:nucleoside phosphorylase
VVGIAGAVPGDLTLGDAVFGNHVHDLTVQEVRSDGTRAFSIKGGPIAIVAQNILANLSVSLPAHLSNLNLPSPLPKIDPEAKIKGSTKAKNKILNRLKERYGTPPRAPGTPFFIDGEIASSDTLVKYGELVGEWRKIAKHILAVEMESAGACKAGREHTPPVPVIPVRAISDVIGLERDDAWTDYACQVAAAFALAFVRSWRAVPG